MTNETYQQIGHVADCLWKLTAEARRNEPNPEILAYVTRELSAYGVDWRAWLVMKNLPVPSCLEDEQ